MMGFNLLDLENEEDGFVDIQHRVHVAEVDRLAGKVIRCMFEEMPDDMTTSASVEVLLAALWWVQSAAFADYAKADDEDRPTRWEQAMGDTPDNGNEPPHSRPA